MILDGKKLAEKIKQDLKDKVATLSIQPILAIIQVGDRPESSIYIKHKKAFADAIGVDIKHTVLEANITESDALLVIQELNNDPNVHGIILQLPLPEHLNKHRLLEGISSAKDVDGLHSINQAKLFQGEDDGVVPATPRGVMSLLREYDITLEGKRVLVIGRSLLVGRPMAMLLLKANATVTIAHSKTQNLSDLVRENDIIVVAAGKAHLLGKDSFKSGQVVLDVGTNSIDGPKTLEEVTVRCLVGDVNFDEVKDIVHAISPVPGGVGPMTVASLFQNLVDNMKN